MVLIGIHTRGVYLARELATTIEGFEEAVIPTGELDVTHYRDDRETRPPTEEKRTYLPVDITGLKVVLVDDVLYTGRTVRAAMDALSDHGRAVGIELAVLIDRGHRELPIRPDYVGKNIPTSRQEVVRVKLQAVDGTNGVWVNQEVAA